MNQIIKTIKENNLLVSITGADESSIKNAERDLDLRFANDYRDFLLNVGACIINGHEINGICNHDQLNVISETIRQRTKNKDINKLWYVIENTHYDSIIIWQSEEGQIFQTSPQTKPRKIADSLKDYLVSFGL